MDTKDSPNSKSIQGMMIGCAIMFVFGILWIVVGLSVDHPFSGWVPILLGAAGIALGTWLGVLAIRLRGDPRRAEAPTAEQAMLARQIGRRFGRINALKWGAIVAAIIVLNLIHRTGLIAPSIAVIVGIHFLPLAALFREPPYYLTGALGCVIGIVGFVIADGSIRLSVVGLSFGLLLWLTVVAVLLKVSAAQQTQ